MKIKVKINGKWYEPHGVNYIDEWLGDCSKLVNHLEDIRLVDDLETKTIGEVQVSPEFSKRMKKMIDDLSRCEICDVLPKEEHMSRCPNGIIKADDSECEHEWYTPDFGDEQANELGTVCRKCDMWKDDYKPKTKIEKLELETDKGFLNVGSLYNKINQIINHLNKE